MFKKVVINKNIIRYRLLQDINPHKNYKDCLLQNIQIDLNKQLNQNEKLEIIKEWEMKKYINDL